MKMHTLKSMLIPSLLLLGSSFLQAQFDDVYFDPDNVLYKNYHQQQGSSTSSHSGDQYGVTYYDDDGYDYYDDYDYYYSSRIRRFHHFYLGFDYFSPAFTSYYYYDPFYSDAYYYPGSSIYVNFGNWNYWNYNSWCHWNNWNYYYPYNNWCPSPYNYYYGYNGWWGGNYNYWNGCNGYYSYSNYYNNYYYGCPYPVGNYYGIDHHTCDWVNDGNERGHYYGPRITGNTGSSPRGPIQPPGITQPVLEGRDLADQIDKPASPDVRGGVPGIHNPSNPVEAQPSSIPASRDDAADRVTKVIPEDKELKREPAPGPKRPVFKPETNRYEPYPVHRTTDETVASTDPKPVVDRPVYKPYTPSRSSTPASLDKPSANSSTDRTDYTPNRDDKPGFKPHNNGSSDRPTYTPPTRTEDRPSYAPVHRNNDSGKENERPRYTPPVRTREYEPADRPSGRSGNSDTRPSNNARSESPSHNSPSRGDSSGSSHSSGNSGSGRSSGSSNSGTSPRGRG